MSFIVKTLQNAWICKCVGRGGGSTEDSQGLASLGLLRGVWMIVKSFSHFSGKSYSMTLYSSRFASSQSCLFCR